MSVVTIRELIAGRDARLEALGQAVERYERALDLRCICASRPGDECYHCLNVIAARNLAKHNSPEAPEPTGN